MEFPISAKQRQVVRIDLLAWERSIQGVLDDAPVAL
jgi:hypothetical protein